MSISQTQEAVPLTATRWECQCDSGGYIRTDDAEEAAAWVADGRTVTAWAQVKPVNVAVDADMVWPDDREESVMYHSIDEAADGEINSAWPIAVGAEFEFICAKHLPAVKVRVTGITEDDCTWEIIPPSAPVSGQGEA